MKMKQCAFALSLQVHAHSPPTRRFPSNLMNKDDLILIPVKYIGEVLLTVLPVSVAEAMPELF